jgi:hypothetical protein
VGKTRLCKDKDKKGRKETTKENGKKDRVGKRDGM